MNTGIYYTTQRVLSASRQSGEQLPDSLRIRSLAQLIFSQESISNSSSMRMCCCSQSCWFLLLNFPTPHNN